MSEDRDFYLFGDKITMRFFIVMAGLFFCVAVVAMADCAKAGFVENTKRYHREEADRG